MITTGPHDLDPYVPIEDTVGAMANPINVRHVGGGSRYDPQRKAIQALNELATEKGIKPAQLAIARMLAKGLAFQLISDELHQFVRRDSFSKLRLPSHNSNAATPQAAGQTRSE